MNKKFNVLKNYLMKYSSFERWFNLNLMFVCYSIIVATWLITPPVAHRLVSDK